MSEIKRIDIKEFREKGYLQELNRKFLHPLGLALEIVIDEDGKESLGGVWDYRKEKEGIFYDLDNSNDERINTFRKKHNFIETELKARKDIRKSSLGFFIEPIPLN